MRRRFWIVVGLCLVASNLLASEIVWLKVTSPFSYRDLFTACSTSASPAYLYFGAEVSGQTATQATLATGFDVLSYRISFSSEEAQGIKFYSDSKKRLWLSELTLSPRLLSWAFQYAGRTLDQCRPSTSLATVGPVPSVFVFRTDGLGEDVLVSNSQIARFYGKRVDGYAYNASLQFVQQQYSSGATTMDADERSSLPWSRTVSAWGSSSSESSAKYQTETNLRWEIDREKRSCERDKGQFSYMQWQMTCNKSGHTYNCRNSATCRCR